MTPTDEQCDAIRIQWANGPDVLSVDALIRAAFAAGRASVPREPTHDLLCNLLWRHQGFNSDVGQSIRKLLGLGPADHMTAEQLAAAKRYDAATGVTK